MSIHSGLHEVIAQAGRERTVVSQSAEVYDDSYIDSWDCSDEEKAQARDELWGLIEEEGVWNIDLQEQCDKCEAWHTKDSCGGFVPGNGYTLIDAAREHDLLPDGYEADEATAPAKPTPPSDEEVLEMDVDSQIRALTEERGMSNNEIAGWIDADKADLVRLVQKYQAGEISP